MVAVFATPSDVEDLLVEPSDGSPERVEALLNEASALVVGHLGYEPEPVPEAVALVTARMVARVLESPKTPMGAESTSYTAGPFATSVSFTQGASGGSPWLTVSDKVALRPYVRRRGGVYSITMS